MSKWTDRTRDKRRKRLAKAAYRRDVARMFNARGREWRVPSRRHRRADERRYAEARALEWAITPLPHEFTNALRRRLCARIAWGLGAPPVAPLPVTVGIALDPNTGDIMWLDPSQSAHLFRRHAPLPHWRSAVMSVTAEPIVFEGRLFAMPREGCPSYKFVIFGRDDAERAHVLGMLSDVENASRALHLICALTEVA